MFCNKLLLTTMFVAMMNHNYHEINNKGFWRWCTPPLSFQDFRKAHNYNNL